MKPVKDEVLKTIRHAALKTALQFTQRGSYRRLVEASKDPRRAQQWVLRNIIERNQDSEFGRRHNFAGVSNADDFRKAIPIHSYEDLRPYIERQEETGDKCLTVERPVFYHRTSGTVGLPKDIPVTTSGLNRIRQHQRLLAFGVARCTDALSGKIFGITGQAREGQMNGGTPFGSASGLLYKSQSKFVRSGYVLPPEVSDIEDYECRYLVMAILGLRERDVTCLGTANPSTLIKLLSVIDQNAEQILRSIGSGQYPKDIIAPAGSLPDFEPDPGRANDLERAFGLSARPQFHDIWPGLKGLMVWTGGSCAVQLRNLRPSLPKDTPVIEIGYTASEVSGTINIDPSSNTCLPTLTDSFFEFVERDGWEAGGGDFLSLEKLEIKGEYYVFVTTADGLYRYDMNDVVRVTGKFEDTPILEFVQKGKGVTSITGEKLYEEQVLTAVQSVMFDDGLSPSFFVALADQNTAGYTLYVETDVNDGISTDNFADRIDQALKLSNIEYAGKRDSGRLTRLDVKLLRPGTGDNYRSTRVADGQRDAQFKYLHLQYAHECPFNLERFVEAESRNANR